MGTTRTFYRIVYQKDKYYSDEDRDTLQEALDRCSQRINDNGLIFEVTEILTPINH